MLPTSRILSTLLAGLGIALIVAAASAVARRTPRRAITRPAMNSDSTAPLAAASSTVDNIASSRPYCVLTDGMCTPQAPASTPSAAGISQGRSRWGA